MFADRTEAGRLLAQRLLSMQNQHPVVLALPRGGLPVAVEIAKTLKAPLDIILVRKIGVPWHRELAVGAIAGPDGQDIVINHTVAAVAGLSDNDVERLAEPEREELRRRQSLYLGGRAHVSLVGKPVILVDDGIATGATAKAALQAIRRANPKRIILAVPVASTDALEELQPFADKIICLEVPAVFYAVGAHYRAFPQLEDSEVIDILAAHPPATN